MTNSIKHAVKDGGTISVEARIIEDNFIQMMIRDDGAGLKNMEQTDPPKTFGLSLISSLVTEQLKGTIRLIAGPGTCFELIWPITPAPTGKNNGK